MNCAISTRFQGYSFQPGKRSLFKAWQAERAAEKALKEKAKLYRLADMVIESMTLANAINCAKTLRNLLNEMADPEAEVFYICAAKEMLKANFK